MLIGIVKGGFEQNPVTVVQLPPRRNIEFSSPVGARRFCAEIVINAFQVPFTYLIQ